MASINALSLAPSVKDWLATSRHPRVLHVFDRACNLINEHREVLSIVTPQIRNGPFNLVLEDDICFSDQLKLESPISISQGQLYLGDFAINTNNARLWYPNLDWGMLHSRRDEIARQLTEFPIAKYRMRSRDTDFVVAQLTSHQSLVSSLASALASADISRAKTITSKLSGLGQGLTPAGDDFVMGAIYAVWIIHPTKIANILAKEIANTAAPLTTSLSAAWLRSAGDGEAGILWHEFFAALLSTNTSRIQETMKNILVVGETSGADALAGFVGVFMFLMEKVSSKHG